MNVEPDWTFVVKKRLSWLSEMLQVQGTARSYFRAALGVDLAFDTMRMLLFYEYLDAHELRSFDAYVTRELQRDPAFLRTVSARCYQQCASFAALGQALWQENWSDKSREELLSVLEQFRAQALLMIPVVYFEPDLVSEIREQLATLLAQREQTEKLDEYFLLLTSTAGDLTIIKEQRDLLRIGAQLQQQLDLVLQLSRMPQDTFLISAPAWLQAALRQHLEAYAWIGTDDLYGAPWSEADLLLRLRYLVRKDCQQRLDAVLRRQKERKLQREQLLSELQLPDELLLLVESAYENSHLRTHRTEVYVRAFYQASHLLNAVAALLGLSSNDVLYLSLDELCKSLRSGTPFSSTELARRRQGMAYQMVDRHLTLYSGDDAVRFAAQVEASELSALPVTVETLEGLPANMGIVSGPVKVVHDIREIGKVQDGDVLVASMTIPEFVPAMERAIAFVTDEGGITCHAAIISREMNVPCIIGTEIATQVLHDGDIVEVNANDGLVRLLHTVNLPDVQRTI